MKRLDEILLRCDVVIQLATKNYAGIVPYEKRFGIAGHFDASQSDKGAINWFDDPDFKLSYNRAYTDNGRRIKLTPSIENRAYHMGKCRSDALVHDNANSSFYGLCITATDGQTATVEQFTSFCVDSAVIARYHQLLGHDHWRIENIDYWLTGHEDWAIPPGRKHDPTGIDPRTGLRQDPPVLDKVAARQVIAAYLNDDPRGAFWSSYDFN